MVGIIENCKIILDNLKGILLFATFLGRSDFEDGMEEFS